MLQFSSENLSKHIVSKLVIWCNQNLLNETAKDKPRQGQTKKYREAISWKLQWGRMRRARMRIAFCCVYIYIKHILKYLRFIQYTSEQHQKQWKRREPYRYLCRCSNWLIDYSCKNYVGAGVFRCVNDIRGNERKFNEASEAVRCIHACGVVPYHASVHRRFAPNTNLRFTDQIKSDCQQENSWYLV